MSILPIRVIEELLLLKSVQWLSWMLKTVKDINFEPILTFSIFGTEVPPPLKKHPRIKGRSHFRPLIAIDHLLICTFRVHMKNEARFQDFKINIPPHLVV